MQVMRQVVDRELYNFSWCNSCLVPRVLPNSSQKLRRSLQMRLTEFPNNNISEWAFRRNVLTIIGCPRTYELWNEPVRYTESQLGKFDWLI